MSDATRKHLAGLMLVAFALAAGCGKKQLAAAVKYDEDDHSPEAQISRIDTHGDEIMASTSKFEARQWMTEPSHIFFKTDPKQVAQFVEEYYTAGAEQVLIADTEDHNGSQYGGALLIPLPQDAGIRAKLFEIDGRADTAFDDDPVSDKGQKYLYHSLD